MDISLNSHEARVLGVLIEKGYTTPDQYPLSLNGTTNGCNQKSNRDPVVDFSEAEVRIALQGLRMKGLIGVTVPAGSRVEKYRHNAIEIFKVGERSVAVIAELLLRGPQTAGEIRTRAKRMRDIASLDALDECMSELESHGFAHAISGGRAARFAQRLCPELHPDGDSASVAPTEAAPTPPPPPVHGAVTESSTAAGGQPGADRVAALEQRVATLESTVARLCKELGA